MKNYYFIILLLIPFQFFSQNWGLDQDFNTMGYSITNMIVNGDDYAKSIAVQSDGKILSAGFGLRLVRHNTNGTLDNSFNGVGYTAAYGNNTSLNEIDQIIVKPDNKILVIGTIYTNKFYLYLAQYNPNGSLDTTFGNSGRKSLDVGNSVTFLVGNAVYTLDDKILIGANSYSSDGDYTLIRCTSSGNLDTTFGGSGIVTVDGLNQDSAGKVIVLTNGKILLSGNSNNVPLSGTYKQHVQILINNDGTIDSNFGTNGKIYTNFNTNNTQSINSAVLLNDGKILLAGSIMENTSTQSDFFVSRINSNGSLDLNFGDNGKRIISFNELSNNQPSSDYINSMKQQSDGKIIVSGYSYNANQINNFALARLNSDGTLDSTFGQNGKIIQSIFGFSDVIYDSQIQADGKIVVAGLSKINSLDRAYVTARFTPNSTLSNSDFEPKNFTFYPNPAHDLININGKRNIKQIEIFDAQGRLITAKKVNNEQTSCDISAYQNGIYFITVTDDFSSKTIKIIKS